MPIFDRISRSSRALAFVTLRPSMLTSPLVRGTRPLTARISVDLPAPDKPTTTTIWPSGISRVRFVSA